MTEEVKSERIVFLRGAKTILRPVRKSTDLERCMRWVNDPEVRQYIRAYLPLNEVDEVAWLDRPSPRNDIQLAIETLDGCHIGNIGFHEISWRDGTATTGTIIGEKQYWGQGYGTDAKMLLLHYAFHTLNLRKICSLVYASNGRSLRYNQKCGYQKEGVRREQYFINGAYCDQILLAVFRDDWEPLWREYQAHVK